MATATILTIGPGPLIRSIAQAVAEGAAAYDTQIRQHHVDAIADPLPPALLEDLRESVGVAIGSSLAPAATEAQMVALNRLAHPGIDTAPVSFRVATTFTSLPKEDPAAGEAVDRVNRLLYRWGAVIVSPGYADEPSVHWLDNRPGVGTRAGDDTTPDPTSMEAAGEQGSRLGALVAIIDGAISRRTGLEL